MQKSIYIWIVLYLKKFFREGRILCFRRHDGILKKTYYDTYGSRSSVHTSALLLPKFKLQQAAFKLWQCQHYSYSYCCLPKFKLQQLSNLGSCYLNGQCRRLHTILRSQFFLGSWGMLFVNWFELNFQSAKVLIFFKLTNKIELQKYLVKRISQCC